MTGRVRAALLGLRPPVLVLLALVLATGWAAGGGGGTWSGTTSLIAPTVSLVAFALCCVVINDLADERVDRVNLAGDPSRWLAGGLARRRHLVAIAVGAALIAVTGATLVGAWAVVVVTLGLAVGLTYSVPPLRLSGRGVFAPLVLPACFVVVPFALGMLTAGGTPAADDLVLLVGLYAGFIGRLLLKDFRDVRGDTMFGKRTFLVRRGRATTVRLSAVMWTGGSALLAVAVTPFAGPLVLCLTACVATVLVLLTRLAASGDRSRDERTISALAIVGRGELLLVTTALLTTATGWSQAKSAVLLLGVTVITVGPAAQMARLGPARPPGRRAGSAEQRAELNDLVATGSDTDG